jgi:DNA-binding transcriptional MocR family regulator
MKASWIAACGPSSLVGEAMQRIEIIADTFLSMNAPVQHALPTWLATRHALQQQIRERMRANLELLDRRLDKTSIQRLALQGGWTAVLRVPRTVGGREFVAAALDRGVLVQPGEFYGLGEARVVVSLLTPPAIWASGLSLLPSV